MKGIIPNFQDFIFGFLKSKSDYNGFAATVQLFITCLVDSFYPETGEAIVSILRRFGLSVNSPREQTCCGQPPFNAGSIVEHTIRVFEKTSGDVIKAAGRVCSFITHPATPCAACTLTVRRAYCLQMSKVHKW